MTEEQKQQIWNAIDEQTESHRERPKEAAEAISAMLQEAFEFEQIARHLANNVPNKYVLEVIRLLRNRVAEGLGI